MDQPIRTVHDVRELLKRFGTLIYTGNRLGDLALMEDEVRELYLEWNLITKKQFAAAIRALRRERAKRQQ